MSRHFSFVLIIFFVSLFISIAPGLGEDRGTEDEYEKKIKDFDRDLQVNPDNADAWLNKGIILKKMGKHSDGEKCIEKAIILYICR
ncbi:MAG TPA: tetratricopeptide repeat protein [Methanoregula sp.]|nr:tetratricopeptide repeat protein [Methanoregula sp.]